MGAPDPTPALDRALRRAEGILFLCSGNMVRSAFAELYARRRGIALPVRSAATTYRNDAIYPEAGRALLARGVEPAVVRAFRPTHVEDLGPLTPGTVVLGMTAGHLQAVERRPGLDGAAFLLGEVLGSRAEIADPVLEGADFEATFAHVERCVDALVERLAHRRAR